MKLHDKLRLYHQDALLSYLEALPTADAAALSAQLQAIDLSCIDARLEADADAPITPLPVLTQADIAAKHCSFTESGLSAMRSGKVAPLILAGGQGTRLGAAGPKGAVDIGITRPYYIFQALFETMKKRADRCGRVFPVYLMVSPQNARETEDFLVAHHFFGYDASFVKLFCQQQTPVTDFDGKLLLASPTSLALSPNGNGGWFASFVAAGLDAHAAAHGVEWLNVVSVDNVLQQIADPAFIGATLQSGATCGAKVIEKIAPDERVGVLCQKGGRPYIVEYYEMTDEMQNETDAQGKLRFRFGAILNYLFSISVLRDLPDGMPIHRVEKKVPYYDPRTKAYVTPSAPNAYKYETLVLDMIAKMPSCLPYEVVREAEFAPIKNATGVDSVESARALLAKNGIVL